MGIIYWHFHQMLGPCHAGQKSPLGAKVKKNVFLAPNCTPTVTIMKGLNGCPRTNSRCHPPLLCAAPEASLSSRACFLCTRLAAPGRTLGRPWHPCSPQSPPAPLKLGTALHGSETLAPTPSLAFPLPLSFTFHEDTVVPVPLAPLIPSPCDHIWYLRPIPALEGTRTSNLIIPQYQEASTFDSADTPQVVP